MAQILFVTWDGGGNQTPALGIAHALAQRGHDVAFLGQGSQRHRVEAAGFAFRAFRGGQEWDALTRLSAAEGQQVLLRTIWFNTDLAADVMAALHGHPVDLVVVDCMLGGVLAGSAAYGAPTAVLVSSLFASTLPARDSIVAFGNRLRVEDGLPPLDTAAVQWERKNLVLVTTLPELDGVTGDPLPNVCYVGPVFDWRTLSMGWQVPWASDDQRPLALVSLSTNAWQTSQDTLQLVLNTLADLPLHVVLTTGGTVPASTLIPPSNTAIYDFVPHQVILPHAAMAITHGGHGSVMAALAYGVPLVCMPSCGADQRIIATRVEAVGAGQAVNGQLDMDGLRSAVLHVLHTPAYRRAAQRLARQIRQQGGAARAALELDARMLSCAGTA
jgi:UDP:flavonoid glycosyltransferase YjiC (YdhE family)